ncbi:uncharacterized protein KQ657_003962 [Scheffersomyces spartinae]|uniref:Post-GPI attachment to proteins factor 3 n=1 Tax=Scheffersomyces spartinae TaxID=45513 RepID=A0A9P7VBB0_9ASCO|nr:uncharacterized protein KQ657_003962 [Scheffersomyces spartinae]KAG7194858.1 hypothetical protein KQ657_003962 [Scheffersomyces spartinae]
MFSQEDFNRYDTLNVVSRNIFQWTCPQDCHYRCQQLITDETMKNDNHMYQFYGKWPFRRVFGIQEFFLAAFSMGNLLVNYDNLKLIRHNQKRAQVSSHPQQLDWVGRIYSQFTIALVISILGWLCSTIFHMRDNAVTETLDYFGANGILLANFNAIAILLLKYYRSLKWTRLCQFVCVLAYVFHVASLLKQWDYQYNMKFGLTVGITSSLLWTWHTIQTNRIFTKHYPVLNNLIELLPYETKVLTLAHNKIRSRLIPWIPLVCNLIVLGGVLLEVFDWHPLGRLVDAHSCWHLITIFPNFIWYDWIVWNVEMLKVLNKIK